MNRPDSDIIIHLMQTRSYLIDVLVLGALETLLDNLKRVELVVIDPGKISPGEKVKAGVEEAYMQEVVQEN